jgi:hypothetical protein
MMLALIVWVGGIIFFAFVLAPTLFSVLPPQLAGNVVSPSLTKLHWMGLVAGSIFLLGSVAYNFMKHGQVRLFSATHLLVLIMLILTAISQFAITPRMQAIRASWDMARKPGYEPYIPGSAAQLNDYYASQFQNVHHWSERIEGAVLLLGFGVVLLSAARMEKN